MSSWLLQNKKKRHSIQHITLHASITSPSNKLFKCRCVHLLRSHSRHDTCTQHRAIESYSPRPTTADIGCHAINSRVRITHTPLHNSVRIYSTSERDSFRFGLYMYAIRLRSLCVFRVRVFVCSRECDYYCYIDSKAMPLAHHGEDWGCWCDMMGRYTTRTCRYVNHAFNRTLAILLMALSISR